MKNRTLCTTNGWLTGHTTTWLENDIIPEEGQLTVEVSEDHNFVLRIGDGIHRWSQLTRKRDDVSTAEFNALIATVNANKIAIEAALRTSVDNLKAADALRAAAATSQINAAAAAVNANVTAKIAISEGVLAARINTAGADTKAALAAFDGKIVTEVAKARALAKSDNDTLAGIVATKAPQASTYTKSEVDARIAEVIGGAPAALDTLQEISAQMGADENALTALAATVAANQAINQANLDQAVASITSAFELSDISIVNQLDSTVDALEAKVDEAILAEKTDILEVRTMVTDGLQANLDQSEAAIAQSAASILASTSESLAQFHGELDDSITEVNESIAKQAAVAKAGVDFLETVVATKADKDSVYTKLEVDGRIETIIGNAPEALDTLKEIADQLAKDETGVAALIENVNAKDLAVREDLAIQVSHVLDVVADLDDKLVEADRVITEVLSTKAPQANTYTKTEVDARIAQVVGNAPEALDTLKEIADQLANDETGVASLVEVVAQNKVQAQQKLDLAIQSTTTALQSTIGVLRDEVATKAAQLNTYTKSEVDNRIAEVIGGAPAALDTLQEIAAQIAADETGVAAIVETVAQNRQDLEADIEALGVVVVNNHQLALNAVEQVKNQLWTDEKVLGDIIDQLPDFVSRGALEVTNLVLSQKIGKKELDAVAATIGTKADKAEVAAVDAKFAGKANVGDVYTVPEVDQLIGFAKGQLLILKKFPDVFYDLGTTIFLTESDPYRNANKGLWVATAVDDTAAFWTEVLNPEHTIRGEILIIYSESTAIKNKVAAAHVGDAPVQLEYEVLPKLATKRTVVWSSSNPAVATVDADGVLKYVGNGVTKITATAYDGATSDSFDLAVATYVTTVALNATSGDYKTYDKPFQLVATVFPSTASDKTLVWTSTNGDIATVDQAGKVTIHGAGSTIIRAQTQDGSGKYVDYVLRVTVQVLVSSVRIDNTELKAHTGSEVQLKTTISPADALVKTLSWVSSDPTAATVDEKGLVKFIEARPVTITGTSTDGTEQSASITFDVRGVQWSYDFELGTGRLEYNLNTAANFNHPVPGTTEFEDRSNFEYKLLYLGKKNVPLVGVEVPYLGLDTFASPSPDGSYWMDSDGILMFTGMTLGIKVYRLVKISK